jgi:acid stress-induced BolA-like protein IbaG/YrbA
VSDAFRGESQINRQAQLWARLRQTLSPEDIVGVVAILTTTPAEVAED